MSALRRAGRAVALALLAGFAVSSTADADDKAALTYAVHEPEVKSPHPPLLVLLHGQGADELDLIGLWPQLPRNFLIVSPRAPFRNANGGYRWYGGGDGQGVEVSARDVLSLIGTVSKHYAVDPAEVFVGGFSQGAALSYQLGLTQPARFRGAAALSGAIPKSAQAPAGADWSRTAFFIAHGDRDDRIPFASARSAQATLAKLHAPTAFHAYPGMGHQITDAETLDLAEWLAKTED
ncbi:alpha/beta hydrolase [Hansschlegelia plantiphila]|uniref:Phospholipase/carboxylesterase n=1 Tax=Hansschlegelia plantiphila TaxID=374655 RepID=A0A9W6J2Z5_9HYPH|nr:prolyl oligopeptidase family serine peptidase [Hansschlegelia plantiphila]GLK68339.1 phospholipase/carboxylesterase [Hansschlegelia plantiphila]